MSTLVFGKFLPFHLGHKKLIEQAAIKDPKRSVVVAVFYTSNDVYSYSDRVKWVREEFINSPYDIKVRPFLCDYPSPYDDTSWNKWKDILLAIDPTIDTIATGNPYGKKISNLCKWEWLHVNRNEFVVSGTQVRSNHIQSVWHTLPDSTKRDMAQRVVFVGTESTGKTTLAQTLAKDFNTVWVPEFGRTFCDVQFAYDQEGVPKDLSVIYETQQDLEREYATQSNGLMFCDTDHLVTSAWEELFNNNYCPLDKDPNRIYFLTDVNIPWVNDGTRLLSTWHRQRIHDMIEERTHPAYHLHGNLQEQVALVKEVLFTRGFKA